MHHWWSARYTTKPVRLLDFGEWRATSQLNWRPNGPRGLQASTEQLQHALDNLKHTQNKLVQSEKLLLLGSIVAGVLHELNTPIGNCLRQHLCHGAATVGAESSLAG